MKVLEACEEALASPDEVSDVRRSSLMIFTQPGDQKVLSLHETDTFRTHGNLGIYLRLFILQ